MEGGAEEEKETCQGGEESFTHLSYRHLLTFIDFSGHFFFSFFFFLHAHCARDSAHVVANPIQPDPGHLLTLTDIVDIN